ncbi:MAG: hypothetical protein NZ949_05190 [Candidatus Kapabacteria bacterium]|nr:hypothetical protein [Candidatus Kapabacteria bacterium]
MGRGVTIFAFLLYGTSVLPQVSENFTTSIILPQPEEVVPEHPRTDPSLTLTDILIVGEWCNHCKKRIEGTVQQLGGIQSARWSIAFELFVTYEPKRLNRTDIQKRLADIGYDTEKFRTSDDAHRKLPKCCRYHSP